MLTYAGDEGVCTWDTDPVLFACMDGDLKALRALLAGNGNALRPVTPYAYVYYIKRAELSLQAKLSSQATPTRYVPLLHMCPHNLKHKCTT